MNPKFIFELIFVQFLDLDDTVRINRVYLCEDLILQVPIFVQFLDLDDTVRINSITLLCEYSHYWQL